ncbi:unnamed protein product [Chondrus crispus]|uniref:Uncharacterized protein n=1 Tax=Chondrus crispus TaxID=2769 RepID=R7QBN6_CHOCR|nr:unnamed protein product [Chondrus crispus]CDF34875.1 unnamed protein product [Chondrus crispus]|eukprot:XP_005714694.1 unnamed protein product [Chondrus crispus]
MLRQSHLQYCHESHTCTRSTRMTARSALLTRRRPTDP